MDSSGVTLKQGFPNSIGDARRIHFDARTNLIYSDNGGVVDATGTLKGTFNPSAAVAMIPDSSLGRAFFVGSGSNSFTITSFNLATFALIDTVTIPNVTGNPLRLIRWGQNGLAFNTDGGQVFIIGGNFVH